jgi:hypothetical protein
MARASARRVLTVAVALGCLARAPDGLCQSADDRVGARAAAAEGARAFSEKRWADSVDLFKRAESLVHAPPHLLYMARGQAELGLLVESRENYLSIIHEDLKADAPQVFRAAKDSAAKEVNAVEARLAYVTLTIKGDVPKDIALTQDGAHVSAALLGVPRPVNPGAHRFDAQAKGLAGTASLTIKETERQKVVLELTPSNTAAPLPVGPAPVPVTTTPATVPLATGTAPPPEATTTTAPLAATTAPEEPTPSGSSKSSGLLIGSFVGFGVGAAGLIMGTVFTLSGSSKSKDADNLFNASDCANTGCAAQAPRISDLDSQSKSAKTIGVVGFIVGGVGVATGVTLLVLYGKSGKSSSAHHETPSMGLALGPQSLLVNGKF